MVKSRTIRLLRTALGMVVGFLLMLAVVLGEKIRAQNGIAQAVAIIEHAIK
jgi:hypothetical protein